MKQEFVELIKLAAAEHYGEKDAADFVRGVTETLEKDAGVMDSVANWANGQSGTIGNTFSEGVGRALGTGLVGGVIGLASSAAGSIGGQIDRLKFLKALEQAIQINRVLQSEDKAKVMSYANTVYKFAPHVACDPNILASVLAGTIHGEGIDPTTIKMLVEMENKYAQTKGVGGFNRR